MPPQAPPAAFWSHPQLGPLLRAFVQRVEAAPSGGTLTSWYRDPARNAAVGGAPRSLHLIGLAIDVAGGNAQAFRSVGLRVLDEGDHLHVSL